MALQDALRLVRLQAALAREGSLRRVYDHMAAQGLLRFRDVVAIRALAVFALRMGGDKVLARTVFDREHRVAAFEGAGERGALVRVCVSGQVTLRVVRLVAALVGAGECGRRGLKVGNDGDRRRRTEGAGHEEDETE